MTNKWKPTQHTVSDIIEWKQGNKLIIKPDFQRHVVWSESAQISLVESILEGFPIPKILLSRNIEDEKTVRTVIDGQQRITAILSFYENKFPLKKPYKGELQNKLFRELPKSAQEEFLDYQLDINEILRPSEEQEREAYTRINKYSIPLNKSELRRADLPGDFQRLSETLTEHSFFDECTLFTPNDRRRSLDMEYISELLAIMLDGIQDKKGKLDDFYLNFSEWPEMDTYENLFDKTLEYYSALFDEDFFFLNKTRFRQKADFYSLFCLMYEYVKKDLKMKDGVSKYVLEDLKFMNKHIEPESVMQSVFVEYAIKCVSDANSRTSRKFRKDVLHSFIGSAFYKEPTNESLSYLLTLIDDQLAYAAMCSSGEDECLITGKIFTIDQGNIAWKKSDNYFGYSNFHFVSESCRSNAEWLVVNRHDKNIF